MPVKKEDGLELIDPDDAPFLTDEMLDDAEIFHGNVFVRRGPVGKYPLNASEDVLIRLDHEVLAALRQHGPGWQFWVNGLLRSALGLGEKPDGDPV